MPFSLILLQAATPSPSGGFSPGQLVFPLAVAAIFYFVIFRPMQRHQRNQKELLKTLQSGQTVLTSGGIIGTILTVNDDNLILRIKPDNLKIQVARSAVTSIVGANEQVKK